MSASDDYDRHRLRTATKYFKVSLKPFQRLVGFGATPREKLLAGCGAAAPRKTQSLSWSLSHFSKERLYVASRLSLMRRVLG